MDVMRMKERRSGMFRAWGISLALHVLLFLLIGASGFFLLVREQPQPSEDDVVDVTMLDDAGGGGGGERALSAAPASAAAAEAPAVPLPPETKLPEIAETYTKEPEKQQTYRKEHQERQAAAASSAAAADDAAGAGQSTGDSDMAKGAAGSGDGTGRGAGSGAGNGTGSGTGDDNGAGAGAGTGTAPDLPPEPVDAGAYCTYRATPAYPQSMVQAGAQGSVTVLIAVSPANAVTDVSVVSSSGYPALDAAAVAAGWACRFQMNGHPGRYRTTYRFVLQGDDDW